MHIEALDQEDAILQRLKAGDGQAFATVYSHYHSFVLSQVLFMVHSAELAEDVTQDIFLKIWENREKLPVIDSFKSYIFITARNQSLNVLKRAARSEVVMSEIVRQFDKVSNVTADQIQDEEYTAFINRKLQELPPRARQIFQFCREQAKSYNEVAAQLGISRDAVKSRMIYVMKTLRHSVKNETG